MKSNSSFDPSDTVDDTSGVLTELIDAYVELAKTTEKKIPPDLSSRIRELGQRVEALIELVELEEEDPELGVGEVDTHVESVLREVANLLDTARSLKACVHQYSR